MTEIQLRTTPKVAATPVLLRQEAAKVLKIHPERISSLKIAKRSIDARQRQVMVGLTLRLWLDGEPVASDPLACPEAFNPLPKDAPQAIVVGAGPAGLFAALRLIQRGVKPILLERGKDVDSRRRDLARIAREGTVDPDSNYCFGEGGAGAYSDGKLYTRSKKRGSVDKVLQILHQHGASEDILVDAHPHIGTDRLPEVIKAIRLTIERCGGEVRFGERVADLLLEDGRAVGVVTARSQELRGPVVMATGHSARDVYHMLLRRGVKLEPKGIAVGVRLEHPQEVIDRVRYHSPEGRGRYLPPAEYTLLTRIDGRAVYSFCMCPGGFIVPAASAPGEMVVNGMSPSNRGTRWANSGMVVEVLPEDVPNDGRGPEELKMMRYQEAIEQRFFADSGDGSQNAPAQRMTDFVARRPSTTLPSTSYAPGIHPARIDHLLPPEIASRLRDALEEFGRKNRGFLTPEATLIGDETRTSSPVRIPRDPLTLSHIEIAGLYPAGEGAGYAGGIVSAAIDGERAANALADELWGGERIDGVEH
ncbi:MAG: FAD-dependent monooxygenase [Bacteroidales bacterium]|nr:FAD-dependent monooxygenase [Bacteroidales bacterium]